MDSWNDVVVRFKAKLRAQWLKEKNPELRPQYTIREFAQRINRKSVTFRAYLSGELSKVPADVVKAVKEYVK